MPVKLLQITDCHLGEEEGERLLGLDTDESLEYVLSDMFSKHESADLLVCSGDLSNEAGEGAYRRLIEKLSTDIPQAWLPGNHDENHLMAKFASEQLSFLGSCQLDDWQVTCLDSSIPHEVPGSIAASELKRSIEIIERYPDRHHVIFMHHHLKPMGCAWLDTQVIDNAEEVLAAFSKYPQLKAVFCGHVHQDNHQRHAHFDLYATPSTCIQFKPNSDDFAVGPEMPGYRLIELHDNGDITTTVNRISERDLNIDWKSGGY